MGRFSSDSDVYATLGRLLQNLTASGGTGAALRSSETVVRFDLADPSAEITLVLFPDQAPVVTSGPTSSAPSVTLSMPADVAHDIFLGYADLRAGINDGVIRFTGPAERLLPAWPLIEFTVPSRYAQQLRDQNREDLLAEEAA